MVTTFTLILFVLLSAGSAAAQTTFYFSDSGDDSDDCLSPGTSCRTQSKAESLPWSAGNSFLYECGSQFVGRLRTQGAGTAGSKITIGAYGTCSRTPGPGGLLDYHTSNNYPKFTYATKVTGFSSAGSANGMSVWSKPDNGDSAGAWFFDHDSNKSTPPVRAAWDEDHHSGCPGSMTEEYEVCYNSSFSTVYVRSSTDPDNLGGYGVEKSKRSTRTLLDVNHKHITVDRINFTKLEARGITVDAAGFTFTDSGCNHNYWRYNIDPNGPSGGGQCMVITAPGVGDAGYDGDDPILLEDCWLYNIGRDSFDAGTFGTFDGDITINRCHFRNAWNHGFGLIGINVPNGQNESFDGTIVVKNSEFEAGCGGLSYGCCDNSPGLANLQFLDNYYHDNQGDTGTGFTYDRWDIGNRQCSAEAGFGGSFRNGAPINVTFRGNVIASSITGFLLGVAPSSSNIVFEYNTCYSMGLACVTIDDASYPITIRGNAFIQVGTDSQTPIRCESCNPNSLSITHNYFDPGQADNHVIRDHNGVERTLSNAISNLSYFNNTNIGNDFGSRPANLIADDSSEPAYTQGTLFITDNDPDYVAKVAPGSGSALTDAGGTACPSFQGTACDIGAVESGEEPDPPKPTVDSAIVRAATPTLFEICFATANPPMLPTSGCTGITLSGTIAAPSSCARNSSNNKCMDVTLDAEPGPTDVITMNYSQASGNITDSTPTEVAETSGFAVINNVGTSLLTNEVCTSPDTFASGRELANSFDGDFSTEEGSSGSSQDGEFVVTCDLGADHDMGISRIYGDAQGTWWCGDYTLEHSTNGTDYTAVVTDTNCKGNQWWEQDLNSVTARYLRWTITGNNGVSPGRTQWRELESYGALSSGGEEPPPPPPPEPGETPGQKGVNIQGVQIQ